MKLTGRDNRQLAYAEGIISDYSLTIQFHQKFQLHCYLLTQYNSVRRRWVSLEKGEQERDGDRESESERERHNSLYRIMVSNPWHSPQTDIQESPFTRYKPGMNGLKYRAVLTVISFSSMLQSLTETELLVELIQLEENVMGKQVSEDYVEFYT